MTKPNNTAPNDHLKESPTGSSRNLLIVPAALVGGLIYLNVVGWSFSMSFGPPPHVVMWWYVVAWAALTGTFFLGAMISLMVPRTELAIALFCFCAFSVMATLVNFWFYYQSMASV